MPETLNWGLIGCGNVVERKSGPSIEQAGRSRMVAVMRRTAEGAHDFAARHGVPFWTADAREVAARDGVQIVYVATPPASHLEYALMAAAAGKHVLVEKPMALSADEGRRMIEACDAAGVKLFVAYYRRFWPNVRKMAELIDAGAIGKPVLGIIDLAAPCAAAADPASWRDDLALSGGGYFIDVGSHRLDVMVHLLGRVEEAVGIMTPFSKEWPVERSVSLAARFASGAHCVATGDYVSGRRRDRFEIIGTGGNMVAARLDSHAFELRAGGRVESFAFDLDPAPHLGLMRHVEAVLLDGAPNRCSGRDGLMTEIMLDHAVRRHQP